MIELNDETKWILGRPNFTCMGIANKLRTLGYEIDTKSEDEQANVIHWMLCLYEKHGINWRKEGEKILSEILTNRDNVK
jgi:hypothetical protein